MLAWMRTDYLTPIEWWLPLEKVGVSLSFRPVFEGGALMFHWCQRPAPLATEQGGHRRWLCWRHALAFVTRGLVNFVPFRPLLPAPRSVRCPVPVGRRVSEKR